MGFWNPGQKHQKIAVLYGNNMGNGLFANFHWFLLKNQKSHEISKKCMPSTSESLCEGYPKTELLKG